MRHGVIEAFVQGKWDDPGRCEDVLVVTDDFAAVIDGATTAPGSVLGGLAPGRFAALSGEAAFRLLATRATAGEAVAFLSRHLADALAAAGGSVDGEAHGAPRAIYSFVAVSFHRREVWRTADCGFAWTGVVDTPRLEMERVPIQARAMLLHGLLATGADPAQLLEYDPSTSAIAPLIAAQACFRNRPGTPWSFGAIDGKPVPPELVDVVSIPEHIDQIVLATDGWPELHPTLAESEAALANTLQADPLMIHLHPAVKGLAKGAISFDDRAYLRLELARS